MMSEHSAILCFTYLYFYCKILEVVEKKPIEQSRTPNIQILEKLLRRKEPKKSK